MSKYYPHLLFYQLLSDCLGQVTIARWRQQLISASKKCQDNPPFIAALLHQIPVAFVSCSESEFNGEEIVGTKSVMILIFPCANSHVSGFHHLLISIAFIWRTIIIHLIN